MAPTRISHVPAFFKWMLPAFVILSFLGVIVWVIVDGTSPWYVYVILVLAVVSTTFIFKKFIWDLVDEVYDAGDHLVFEKGGIKQKVSFADIEDIGYVSYTSPRRITVTCRKAGSLGDKLVFMPPVFQSLNPAKTPPMVTDLIDRMDAARSSS